MKHYILIILSFFIYLQSFAQDVKATAKLDAYNIKIGDQVKLHLSVQHPSNYLLNWASPPDSLGKIEIVESSKIDTLGKKDSSVITENQTIIITSFDSGFYAVPPFVFSYKKGKDTVEYTAETKPLLLTVNTVAVDTSKAFMDIKAPLETPYNFAEFWAQYKWYCIGGLAAILIGLGLWYYLTHRKKVVKVVEEKIITRPAHEIAFEDLKKVEAEKLWQQGFVKQYYSGVSDVIRAYIENRYHIIAMELTTDEILYQFKARPINPLAKEKLSHLLQLSDLVKFAKVQPLPNEHDLCLNDAYDFVRLTKAEGLGIEDLGLGGEDDPTVSPSPNPQSHVPNPQSPTLNPQTPDTHA
jgi:hypothetical protein